MPKIVYIHKSTGKKYAVNKATVLKLIKRIHWYKVKTFKLKQEKKPKRKRKALPHRLRKNMGLLEKNKVTYANVRRLAKLDRRLRGRYFSEKHGKLYLFMANHGYEMPPFSNLKKSYAFYMYYLMKEKNIKDKKTLIEKARQYLKKYHAIYLELLRTRKKFTKEVRREVENLFTMFRGKMVFEGSYREEQYFLR